MVPGLIAKRVVPFARQFGTSAARRAHDTSGVVGSTLPFGIKNRYLVTLGFTLFFGSGLAIPFLIVRWNLLKQK